MGESMSTIRIGMVNYINTAPIYEEWKKMTIDPDWVVTEAPPSTLNILLAEDRLDLGLVSSYEYAVRPYKYRILSDLSISATGPVGSVFLFSSVRPEDLSGKRVLLTGQSETSVALVKIVLEEFLSIKPSYKVGDIFDPRSYKDDVSAVLAIGDDALRLKEENRYPYQLDLADAWNKKTGLPFVFAVFAVRREIIASQPAILEKIWHTLLQCRERGQNNLLEISKAVAPRIPMDDAACYRYLQNIEHTLGAEHSQALESFFRFLIKRGECSEKALPLKFFPDKTTG